VGHDTVPFRVFEDSYNVYELACDTTVASQSISSFFPQLLRVGWRDRCAKSNDPNLISEKFDIPLSTAVSLSARFPFVSPHGDVRNQNVRVVDRLVDGGYFDDSGAVTALELARSIKRIDPNLRPYIVQISNEPEFFGKCGDASSPVLPPEIIDAGEVSLLDAPGDLLALNATRNARSYHTGFELPGRIEAENGFVKSHTLFFPCSQPKQPALTALLNFLRPLFGMTTVEETKREPTKDKKSISISWWLSPPVQAYLDAQLCGTDSTEIAKSEVSWRNVLELLRKSRTDPTPPVCSRMRRYVR
jgi:hypothetical protein